MVKIKPSAGGGGFLAKMAGKLFRRAGGRSGRRGMDGAVDGMPPPRGGAAGRGPSDDLGRALAGVNPKGHTGNCVKCAIVHELRRRGLDVSAGPLSSGTHAMHSPKAVKKTFGKDMVPASRDEIVRVFEEAGDGARGIVRVEWPEAGRGHSFNVENVGGQVRFVDGQPVGGNPGASYFFDDARVVEYARVDDAPMPDWNTYRHYIDYDPRDLLR